MYTHVCIHYALIILVQDTLHNITGPHNSYGIKPEVLENFIRSSAGDLKQTIRFVFVSKSFEAIIKHDKSYDYVEY